MDKPTIPLELEELEALDVRFPGVFTTKSEELCIFEVGPLTQEHVEAAASAPPAPAAVLDGEDIKAIRPTHHRIAQLLASGMDVIRVATLTSYTPARIYYLRDQSPAFAELIAFYRANPVEGMADWSELAGGLSLDLINRLQQMLDEKPESFTPSTLLDAIRTLADRTGNAPVTKNMNLNVNVGLGDKLRLARERANAALMLEQATEVKD